MYYVFNQRELLVMKQEFGVIITIDSATRYSRYWGTNITPQSLYLNIHPAVISLT